MAGPVAMPLTLVVVDAASSPAPFGPLRAYDGPSEPGWPRVRRSRRAPEGETTTTSAPTGSARVRSGMSRRASRMLVSVAIAAVVIALAVIFLGDTTRDYHLIMQNAGQLVPGDLVRIGGVQAGSVKALELTP